MRLELGKRARCSDGAERELADLVLDASSRRVTHLVVQPEGNPGDARLVPVELAAAGADEHEISLRCTEQQLEEWWRREISIPAEAVAELTNDMVTLGVSKSELGAFPSERR